MKVLVNAALIDLQESTFDEQGWLAGSGIFETIKTVNAVPWALSRHMRRAVNSALSIGLQLPSEEAVRETIPLLLATQRHDRGMLRISFAGHGKWAAIHLPYQEVTEPAKLLTYSRALVIDGQPIKTFPYAHRLNILNEVKAQGFDEALVTSNDGKVCEGAVTNLLLQIDGRWITPPISDGVLAGIVRALVIEHCDVEVRSIEVDEIVDIESAFLMSSLRIAQSVAAIDGRDLAPSLQLQREIQAMALRTSVG